MAGKLKDWILKQYDIQIDYFYYLISIPVRAYGLCAVIVCLNILFLRNHNNLYLYFNLGAWLVGTYLLATCSKTGWEKYRKRRRETV